jgi:small GTP-binding protein
MIREIIQAKVTIIGNANVGKSSIVHRFINETHLDNSEPTIGANFLTKTLDFENFSIKLSIWDTAGQERYSSLASSYTRGSTCCLLVYDITNHDSFSSLSKWLSLIQENLDPDCIVFALGNKEDLLSQEKVHLEEAKSFCNEHNLTHYRVSAKSGVGIEKVFMDICKKLMGCESLALIRAKTSSSYPRGFSVSEVAPRPVKKKCC